MYKLNYTDIGRGLSTYQKAILGVIREKGELSIYDVWRIYYHVMHGRPLTVRYEEVTQIPWVERLYRAMRSLERRGEVARLLHRRPARWFSITWQDGSPLLPENLPSDFRYFFERKGKAEFTTKGMIFFLR